MNPFKWAGIALVVVGMIGLLVGLPFYIWGGSPSSVATNLPAPIPANYVVAPAVVIYPDCNKINTIEVGNDPAGKPINKGARCSSRLKLASQTGCIQVKVWGEWSWRPETFCKGSSNVPIPDDVEYIRSARPEVLTVKVTLLGPIIK